MEKIENIENKITDKNEILKKCQELKIKWKRLYFFLKIH